MKTIFSLLIEITLAIGLCFLLVHYLRPHLGRILVDVCGTEQRAQFWTVFANIILVGLPVIIGLGFRPEATTLEESVFEIIGRLSVVLAGFILALIVVGIVVGFFALVAPRPTNGGEV